MLSLLSLVLTGLFACTDPDDDRDGVPASEDCDDADPDVFPGADERCDGVDNDCDGEVDEADALDALAWHADDDGDGYGGPEVAQRSCTAITGFVSDASDCDDTRADVFPGADEYCDGTDSDCDGTADDGAIDAATWYRDGDGDGYGDTDTGTRACTAPTGFVVEADDCDDASALSHPGAPELCDGEDNDCDGTTDEDILDGIAWYADADGDGFGDAGNVVLDCVPPAGHVRSDDDCDDARSDVFPGADEYCDDLDNDCDGVVDEDDALDARTWYADDDGDTFGDPASTVQACAAPAGHVANDADCDDATASTYPGAVEYCDGIDTDCDGTDDGGAVDAPTWYRDADTDAFGDPGTSTLACARPVGFVADATDCDDADPLVSPDADEYCDQVDNDCDATTDEDDALDAPTWYADTDGDAYGDPTVTARACTAPQDFVSDDTDCDDTDASVNPATTWYYDADGDGYGDGNTFVTGCTDPGTYYVPVDGDCRPSDANSHPGAEEVCWSGTQPDGFDNDCDGAVDEECPQVHCGSVVADETWGPGQHHVTCAVYVQGSASPTLTIAAGAEVTFAPNAGLFVGFSGAGDLHVDGTVDQPVVFRSDRASPQPGDWLGLVLQSRTSDSYLDHLVVEDAGGSSSYPAGIFVASADVAMDGVTVRRSARHGLYVSESTVELTNAVITDNVDHGVYCASASCLGVDQGFAGNLLSGNGAPLRLFAPALGALSPTTDIQGNVDDRIVVWGGTIREDTAWRDLGVPYRVANPIYVQDATNAPVLTVEDGVEAQFDRNAGLYVANSYPGDLVVDGHTEGVQLGSSRDVPAPGDWYGLVVGRYTGPPTQLTGLTVRHGGSSSSYPSNLHVSGAASLVDVTLEASDRHGLYASSLAQLTLDGVVARDNDDHGLWFQGAAELDNLGDIEATGNGAAPIRLPFHHVDQLASGAHALTGNGTDAVEVTYHQFITDTLTVPDPGVPYHALDSLYLGAADPAVADVRIADGVELLFADARGLWVGSSGRNALLDVQGDPLGQGVRFGSVDDGGPGSWYGIDVESGATVTMRGFTLEDAGYSASWAGGLHVLYGDVTLEDCTIADNERAGVYAVSSSASTHADVTLRRCVVEGTTSTDAATLPDGDGLFLTDNEHHAVTLEDVVFTGNARHPLTVHANQMGALDPGSSFTGNGDDRVRVHGGYVRASATWTDPGVPWWMTEHVYLRGTGSTPTDVSVDGGTFQFDPGKRLLVGFLDAATLDATDATFTSAHASPLPGDWCGLFFDDHALPSTLDGVTVAYGGRSSGCPGGFAPGNVGVFRSAVTITNSTLSDASTAGFHTNYDEGSSLVDTSITDNDVGIRCANTPSLLRTNVTFSGNTTANTDGCP
jgi:hypothetical protein